MIIISELWLDSECSACIEGGWPTGDEATGSIERGERKIERDGHFEINRSVIDSCIPTRFEPESVTVR